MDTLKNKWKSLLAGLLAILYPVLFFYLMEFYTRNPFAEIRPWAQLFNVLLFELVAAILFSLTRSVWLALRLEAVAAMVFGLANAYVVRFRTNPLVPWDFLSWRTALGVADNYDFTPDGRMAVVTALFLVAIVMAGLFHRWMRGKTIYRRMADDLKERLSAWTRIWLRILFVAVECMLFAAFCNVLQQEDFQNSHRLYNKLFTPAYMTKVDGIAVTFVMDMAYMSVDKPAAYSIEEAQALLAGYEDGADVADGGTEELPNLIVVMDESFSDLSVLGQFETNEDYMPYLHSLMDGAEDTVTGMLHVSVCGGNTADTEFEFLTGNTMAFLPQGSIPYQQYIKADIPSLASHLAGLGYQTVATHPYYASGWERERVYPLLGFGETYFRDAYSDHGLIRKYVSDDSCVDKIIECYEGKEEGSPLFLFQVTMQNHGGYQDLYSNFTPDIQVDGIDSVSVSQYLSLVRRSDAALEKLISYFSGVEEKTVVVFFGDHQPGDAVAAPILRLNGKDYQSLDEEDTMLRYQVPYVIWANYDIEEEQGLDMSVNYLAAEVLERAGIRTDAYANYLRELQKRYPVISAVQAVCADGSTTTASQEGGQMDIYRKLQYYRLFDSQKKQLE